MKVKEAIKENFRTLLQHFIDGEISYKDIQELHEEAVNDEEYEVAESIKQVLDEINNNI